MQMVGVDGQPVSFKAINYFGFNNGATMFDGLYAGSNSLTQDFGMNLYRIQARLNLCADSLQAEKMSETGSK